MSKRSGMYKSEKRKKEMMRKKKQEEKKLKRQKNVKVSFHDSERTDLMNIQPEFSEVASELKSKNEDTETADK